jgi:hypothetical protein
MMSAGACSKNSTFSRSVILRRSLADAIPRQIEQHDL